MIEPSGRRVIGFVDGQNVFYAAKQAFGYSYPNFDPRLLTEVVAAASGWTPAGTRFYTGVPDQADNPFWSHFWAAKLAVMGTQGIDRFRLGQYGSNHRLGFMTGYLLSGSDQTTVDEINAYIQSCGRIDERLAAARSDHCWQSSTIRG